LNLYTVMSTISIVMWRLLKAGIAEPEETAAARERLCKHVSTATNSTPILLNKLRDMAAVHNGKSTEQFHNIVVYLLKVNARC
jgi:hypothetical protein